MRSTKLKAVAASAVLAGLLATLAGCYYYDSDDYDRYPYGRYSYRYDRDHDWSYRDRYWRYDRDYDRYSWNDRGYWHWHDRD